MTTNLDQQLGDVASAAFDYCNYWADKVRFCFPDNVPAGTFASEALGFGHDLEVREIDSQAPSAGEGQSEWHPLTRQQFLNGCKARATQCGLTLDRWIEEHDAVEADAALQLALFGEVVYG